MFGLTEDEIAIAFWRMHHDLVAADQELQPFQSLQSQRRDWLSFARRALLISIGHASQQMDVSRSSFLRIEDRESTGQVTLAKLREAAEAIDCELVYAIRPKNGHSFAEASWLRLADEVNAKAKRRHCPPHMRGHMKLSIAKQLLGKAKNLRRLKVNRQRRQRVR